MSTPAVVVEPPIETKNSGKHADVMAGKANWWVKTIILVTCILWMIPAVGVVLTSFRTEDAAKSSGWWTVITNFTDYGWTSTNYSEAWTNADLGPAFLNSLAIALPATFIPILIAAFAAYAFTFMDFKFRDTLFIIIVSMLVVPNYVAFVPILKVYTGLDIRGFPTVWLAHIGFGMSLAIYLFRTYMSTLPRSVIESARIDGASDYQTFYRLVLPMSIPVLASFAVFQFLWVWNDLLVALVFLGPGENAPVTVATSQLLGQRGEGWNLVTAAGLITAILPIIIFLALQRYFVRGLTAGAVKG